MARFGNFIREKILFKYRIKGKNNRIFFKENGKLKSVKHRIKGLNIHIVGNNNTIIFEKPVAFENCAISIFANNTDFQMKSTSRKLFNVGFSIQNDNTKIDIGRNLSAIGMEVYVGNKNSSFKIGNDCIFSDQVLIMNHDAHWIYDKDTKEIINDKPYHLEIGDHVWVGRRVTINKRAKIPSGCIIGMNSFVLHPFEKENCILAGYPARIVKENIHWEWE